MTNDTKISPMVKVKSAGYRRASSEQIHLYRKYVKKYPELDDTRKNSVNSKYLQNLWAELAESMNAMRGPKRSAMKWRESLSHWKHQHICRIRKANVTARKGPSGSRGYTEGLEETTVCQMQQLKQMAQYDVHALAEPIFNSPQQEAICATPPPMLQINDVIIKEELNILGDILNSPASSSAPAHSGDDMLPLVAPTVTQTTHSMEHETCVEMCQQVMLMLEKRDERDRSFQQDCMKLQQTMAESLNKIGDGLLAISQLGRDVLNASKNENLPNG